MVYGNGKYKVDMAPDGAIHVKPGDWLSKYSAALYDNFNTLQAFGRKGKNGLEPVKNPDLIYAGETIYHLPTHYRFRQSRELYMGKFMSGDLMQTTHGFAGPKEDPSLPSDIKKATLREALNHDFPVRGNHGHVIDKLHGIAEVGSCAGQIAEVFGAIATGGVAVTVAAGAEVAAAVLLPVVTAVAVVNANEFGLKIIGLRAIAYALTAWAFGDKPPAFPRAMRAAAKGSFGEKGAVEYEKAWNEARDSAEKLQEEDIRKKGVRKANRQEFMQALGKGDRNELARELLKGLEESLRRGSERDTLWAFELDYPN